MLPLTKQAVLSILQKFLPEGAAWPRALDSVLAKVLTAFAFLFSLLDLRLRDLLAELNPATANEMLADWEDFTGACDVCCTVPGTVADRRNRVVAKLNEQGNLSKAYFLGLASALGYSDTAISECGPSTCVSDCEAPVTDDEHWRFVWKVNLPHQGANHSFFRADSRVDERVDSYAFGALECQFTRLKPAHTYVNFTYEGL